VNALMSEGLYDSRSIELRVPGSIGWDPLLFYTDNLGAGPVGGFRSADRDLHSRKRLVCFSNAFSTRAVLDVALRPARSRQCVGACTVDPGRNRVSFRDDNQVA
jgi:hypothetical protein